MANKIKYWQPQKPPFSVHKEKVFHQLAKTGKIIYQIGESEALREKSVPVKISSIKTSKFKAKVEYLKKCLLNYRQITGIGRGITAVQVGIQERFSVIYMPDLKGKMLIIINPKVIKVSNKKLEFPEICMSASPIIAKVKRPSWIEFEYLDEEGNKRLWNKRDDTKENKIYNRVFQHEIDHMNGVINIDLVDAKTLILESDPKFYDKASFTEV